MMDEPFVSIIIPVKDGEATIEKCLNSLLNLNYKNYEIIIVDDLSKDKTREILKKYQDRLKVILNPTNLGPSESRNIASRQVRGEFLAFTDADCIVGQNWLKELRKGFEQFPDAVSCGGKQDIPEDASCFQKKVFFFMKKTGFIAEYMRRGSEKIIEVSHNASCCVIYKNEIFLKAGGFLKNLWPGEDVDLDYRLKNKGYKIVFNPEAIVYHYRPKDLRSFLRMMYRYGMAQGVLVRKYGIFRRIQILPFFALGIFALCLIALWLKLFKLIVIFFLISSFFLWAYFSFQLSVFVIFSLSALIWHAGFFKSSIKNHI